MLEWFEGVLSGIWGSTLNIVGVILGAILSDLLLKLRAKTGIDIRVGEAQEIALLRARLDEALVNGAQAVLAKGDAVPPQLQAAAVVDHLHAGIPDALAILKAQPDVLQARAEATLAAVKASPLLGFPANVGPIVVTALPAAMGVVAAPDARLAGAVAAFPIPVKGALT